MRIRIDRPFKYVSKRWEKQPALAWAISGAWILLVCGLVFYWHLGSIGLVDETEPLFAEAARQMTLTGDWVTPYFNGATRFDKPPLVYWLMAIGYETIGVNEWAARLPSALSASGLTIFGFFTLRRFGYPSSTAIFSLTPLADPLRPAGRTDRQLWLSAWIGAALIALNLETIIWARTGVSDMLLSGCMGSALLSFFWGYAQPSQPQAQTRWYLAFYVFSALAVLTKGPIGLVLPGLIIAGFLLYMGNAKAVLQEMQLVRGGSLFLVLTLPWYILVIWANGQAYIDDFFGYHNFERLTSVVNHHAAPWFFYFVVVLLGFMPWSAYLPAAIARLRFWQRHRWQQQPRVAHLGLFLLAWFIGIFGLFTIAVTKLPSYVLPLMPAAAMLVGLLWSDQITRRRWQREMQISALVNLGLLMLMAAAVFYSANWMGDDPAMPDLPEAVRQSGILIWGGLIWAIAAGVGTFLLMRRQGHWLWIVNLVAFIAFFILTLVPAFFLMDAQRQLPLRQLAETIVQIQKPKEDVIMLGFEKPSLTFYTRQSIDYQSHPDRMIGYFRRMSGQTSPPPSVLVIGYPDKIKEMSIHRHHYRTIRRIGAYQLIRVPLPLENRGK
jgi:4-amino-4-deoxy-L-arabinose transferase-like glycosyltransferase